MKTSLSHNSTLARREPSWKSVDPTMLPELAFATRGPDQIDWQFPHHWVRGAMDADKDGRFDTGTLFLHRAGLEAAWAVANATGQRATPAVLAHLRKHFAAIGISKATWDGVTYDVRIYDPELKLAGLVTAADLEINPGAYSIRVLGGLE